MLEHSEGLISAFNMQIRAWAGEENPAGEYVILIITPKEMWAWLKRTAGQWVPSPCERTLGEGRGQAGRGLWGRGRG